MAEPAYTVASDSETSISHDDKHSYPETAVGIDLGTSQCSVGIWNGSEVELLTDTRNRKLIRSHVIFKEDTASSGVSEKLAHDDQNMYSGNVILNMKRLVGRVDTDPVVHASKSLPFMVQTLDIGVKPFVAAFVNNVWRSTTPEEVLALFLVKLKDMAEAHLKRPVRSAVLTVPVSFSRFQHTRLERACSMAGLQVMRLMPEPTAVALLYAQQQQQISSDRVSGSNYEKVALIFNMGAGYCDVAITATAGGVSQIKASLGLAVGAEDMLYNVIRHLVPDFDDLCSNYEPSKVKSVGLLRTKIQESIHKLCSHADVCIKVRLNDGRKIERTLTRAEFEAVNTKVFEKCEVLVKQCMHDAKIATKNIDDVILVGGCSSIPKIRSLVLGLCEKDDSYHEVNSFEAAASGAALEAAIASGVTDPSGALDLLTIQATAQSLGIRAGGNGFVPIIQRNTAIPVRKDMIFTTAHDNQTEALIVIYEGEGKLVQENHLLGYFKLRGIPAAPKGSSEINVCLDIDASNVLRVLAGAIDPVSGQPISPFVEVRMPMLDDGQGWCGQSLVKMYGTTLDLATVDKMQQ